MLKPITVVAMLIVVKNRTLTYNFHSLKSIIFGIKTFDEDKLRIIDIIHRKCKENNRDRFQVFSGLLLPTEGRHSQV